jgi:hypothetical protein
MSLSAAVTSWRCPSRPEHEVVIIGDSFSTHLSSCQVEQRGRPRGRFTGEDEGGGRLWWLVLLLVRMMMMMMMMMKMMMMDDDHGIQRDACVGKVAFPFPQRFLRVGTAHRG